MSERKELCKISYITDDDCGMYRLGEIDWIPNGVIERYVQLYGQYGQHQILEMCSRIIVEASHGIRLYNAGLYGVGSSETITGSEKK